MTLHNDDQEITIEVQPSIEGQKPTKNDVERAINQKLEADPTQLFVHGDTVILKVQNIDKPKHRKK
jgi:hypothetical protein